MPLWWGITDRRILGYIFWDSEAQEHKRVFSSVDIRCDDSNNAFVCSAHVLYLKGRCRWYAIGKPFIKSCTHKVCLTVSQDIVSSCDAEYDSQNMCTIEASVLFHIKAILDPNAIVEDNGRMISISKVRRNTNSD
jgi:hypothetical protein